MMLAIRKKINWYLVSILAETRLLAGRYNFVRYQQTSHLSNTNEY
jgi:hypothetical protein